MKDVLLVLNIDAQFPELKGGACNQRGRGKGSSLKAAGAAAWRDLLNQPKLKRKRFTQLTANISIGKQSTAPIQEAVPVYDDPATTRF